MIAAIRAQASKSSVKRVPTGRLVAIRARSVEASRPPQKMTMRWPENHSEPRDTVDTIEGRVALLRIMPKSVVDGAMLKCNEGIATCTLQVSSSEHTDSNESPLATVEDYGMANISGFRMCKSSSNPMVSAANGVPQTCTPVITSAWSPGHAQVTLNGKALLTDASTCDCSWNGTIEVEDPGRGAFDLD
jgi:hypothetical protein